MCGIFGIWRKKGFNHEDKIRLVSMGEKLIHRGPDDYGYLQLNTETGKFYLGQKEPATSFSANLFLGSRRLSILDISFQGRQPMTNEREDVFLVFNGEIYNYKKLKKQLKSAGHNFTSNTDTEVLVHAYEEWGIDFVKRLEGMWAFILWDQQQRRLLYCRDRFGIKPLFIKETEDVIYFASEVKGILEILPERPAINYKTVANYIAKTNFGNGNNTFFYSIQTVPKAFLYVHSLHSCESHRYWSYSDQSEVYDYHDIEGQFRSLLENSIRKHSFSERPVGLLLSGGLDSSTIAGIGHTLSVRPFQHAFTASFPNQGSLDEYPLAKLVADRFNLSLHRIEYDPANLITDIENLIYYLDAPPSMGQELVRYKLLEQASQYVSVIYEGQGADEELAGYVNACLKPYFKDELKNLSHKTFIKTLHRMMSAFMFAKADRSLYNYLSSYHIFKNWSFSAAFKRALKTSVLSEDLRQFNPVNKANYIEDLHFNDHLTKFLHLQHSHQVLPHLLDFGDQISMAHSIESRVPFLDHYLVEFLFALPYQEKLSGENSKFILRKSMKNLLPAAILNTKTKKGFSTPLQHWLNLYMESTIWPTLRSRKTQERGIFNTTIIEKIIRENNQNKALHHKLLFRCFALELWFRNTIDA